MKIIIFTILQLLAQVNAGALFIRPITSDTISSFVPPSQDLKQNEVPYHVILYEYRLDEGMYKAFCSGALVQLDTIITSAECLENITDENTIYAGFADNLEQVKMRQSSNIYNLRAVDWIKIHPNWRSSGGNGIGNLAVIKLKLPFAQSKEAQAIPLVAWFHSYITSDAKITVSGFTSVINTTESSRLQIHHQTPFSPHSCTHKFGVDKLCTRQQGNQTWENSNYNGGPLVVRTWTGNTLYGIRLGSSIRSDNDKYAQAVDIYTDIWYYKDWLTPMLITPNQAIDQVSSERISGRITSPNHPYKYILNSTLTWEILAPPGHKVRITLEYIDVEVNVYLENCYDTSTATMDSVPILVVDGCRASEQSSVFFISNSNQIFVRFYSDETMEETGFSLFYESFTDETGPPIPVPKVSFFTEFNLIGNNFTSQIRGFQCINFHSQYSSQVSSVDTGDRCVILYMSENCKGIFVELYPGSWENHLHLSPEFDNKAKSYSACLYSNRGPSFTHPDKYIPKERNTFILTDDNFDKAVVKSEFPWLVLFAAPSWCGHSETFLPLFKVIARVLKGTVFSGWVDVDDHPNTVDTYQITQVPTILYFPGGDQPYEEYSGERSVVEIVDWVKREILRSELYDD